MTLSMGYLPSIDGFFITADLIARGSTPLGSDQTYLDTYYGTQVK